MFWLHHPQPVRPRKAVAEQMVATKMLVPMSTAVIIIDSHPVQTDGLNEATPEHSTKLDSLIHQPMSIAAQ